MLPISLILCPNNISLSLKQVKPTVFFNDDVIDGLHACVERVVERTGQVDSLLWKYRLLQRERERERRDRRRREEVEQLLLYSFLMHSSSIEKWFHGNSSPNCWSPPPISFPPILLIYKRPQTMVEAMEGIKGARSLVTAAFFISGATVGSSPLRSLVLTNWKRHGCSFFIGASTPVPHRTHRKTLLISTTKLSFFKLATCLTAFGNDNPNWRPFVWCGLIRTTHPT